MNLKAVIASPQQPGETIPGLAPACSSDSTPCADRTARSAVVATGSARTRAGYEGRRARADGRIRIALDDAQWIRIAERLPPGLTTRAQRNAPRYRKFVECVLLVAVNGLPWHALGSCGVSWRGAYVRFLRWCETGAWDGVIDALEPNPELCSALKRRVNRYRQIRVWRRREAERERAYAAADQRHGR